MTRTSHLPADATAQRIVRHFQAEGFAGISEALIVRVALRKGDRLSIDTAFDTALDNEVMPPVGEFFEIRPFGFYSEQRSFADAKGLFQSDFGGSLRRGLPNVFFDAAPVVIDDALATSTKYDAMLKLSDNASGYALAILLNDPNSSFFEYLGTHRGYDWHSIMGDLETAASSFDLEADLF